MRLLYQHIHTEITHDAGINLYKLFFWLPEIILVSGQEKKTPLRYILTMVTYGRTVTTEAAVATTISRAPAVHVAAEEKIHCPSLHLKLSKIKLPLKDNVHTLLYISSKKKTRRSKYASRNSSVNMEHAGYCLQGAEHSDSLPSQRRETSITISAPGFSAAPGRAPLIPSRI